MGTNIFYLSSKLDKTFQTKALTSYAKKLKIQGDFIDEELFNSLKKNSSKNKTLFVTNLLCLGSNLEKIKQELCDLTTFGVDIVSIEDGFEFLSNEKTAHLLQGIEIAIQIKSACNSLVMKNKLAQKKKNGGIIGRHKGAKNLNPSKCELKKEYIFQALKQGTNKNTIAKEIGVSVRTLFNFLKLTENKG